MVGPAGVGAALLAAAAIGTAAWAYRRLAGTRARLLAYMGHAAPEMTVERLTRVGFTAVVLGSHVEVDLATLARRRPPRLSEQEWFDVVLDGIRARVPVPQAPPYVLVMDRLLPLLKPRSYTTLFERYPQALRLAWRPLADHLTATYVIAGTHQRTLVSAGMVATWGVGLDVLHALAVDNLRKQTTHMLEEIGGPQTRYEHLDGADATRILVADLLIPPDVSDPVIAIPEETLLWIAPAADAAALAVEASSRFALGDRPLSPLLFRPTPTGPIRADEPARP